MKFTNKYNLPQHICDWLGFDEYDYQAGAISATTLIGPARAWALKQIHTGRSLAGSSEIRRIQKQVLGTGIQAFGYRR